MPAIDPQTLKRLMDLYFAPRECSQSDIEKLASELNSHRIGFIDLVERCEHVLPIVNQLSSTQQLTPPEAIRLVLALEAVALSHDGNSSA